MKHALIAKIASHEQFKHQQWLWKINQSSSEKQPFLEKIEEKSKLHNNQSRMCGKGVGLGLFLLTRSNPSYDFDEIAHSKPLYGVESL